MKLKLFENFKNEYYEEVDEIAADKIFINDYEKKRISLLIPPGYRLDKWTDLGTVLEYDNVSKDIQIFITLRDDEWYYVESYYPMRVYKCDQFEGLKKCLEDIL